jgi:hypothetical protein
MGQTSDPETLVINQKLTPGNNPQKHFKQQTKRGFPTEKICLALQLID